MRIGLFTTSRTTIPPEKGIVAASANLTAILADGLVKEGHEITLYAPQGSKSKAKIIDLSMPPSHLDYALSPFEWVKNLNLATKLLYIGQLFADAKNFDMIHLQTEPIYLGMPFAGLTDTPVIVTNHNVFIEEEKPLLRKYSNIPIVTISKFQASQAKDLNIIGTIYDAIDIGQYDYYSSQQNLGYMHFFGRIIREKGVETAIEAAHFSGKKLIISGIGEKEYVETKIKPNLSKNIEMNQNDYGSIPWHDGIGQAKFTLFPIQWEEPFGLVMIESLASGTPVIAFARGSVPEIIKDGITGFIVNASNEDKRGDWITQNTGVKGLLEAIQNLCSKSNEKYEQMRQNCRKHAEQRFDADRMINEYINIYKKVVKK